MNHYPISEKKQKLIDERNISDIIVGDRVFVNPKALSSYVKSGKKPQLCTVISVDGDDYMVYDDDDHSLRRNAIPIKKSDIIERWLKEIGENPFNEKIYQSRPVAFSFDSILFTLDVLGDRRMGVDQFDINGIKIKEVNWNPFVYDKDGNKQYYQRPFVWSVEDSQLLIESIYLGIECGKILVRKRGWDELQRMVDSGETELYFNDLVDGKQRLNAVRGFMTGEFPDMYGNYFGDLSMRAQSKFVNHQLFTYMEMPENSSDEDVINQFLKINFAGVPQSKEHIEFVKGIQNKIK